MEEPDPATVRAAAAGDLDAFATLVRGSQMHVWRFLRHLLGDAVLAEDVTQETFIRIFRHLAGFRHDAKFSTWVLRVARNAGIDALRARERRERLLRATTAPRSMPDASLPTELAASLASLSPRLREAFLLVEVLGLSYAEAATALQTPEGTVKSRVFRARGQLVDWLRAGDAGEVGSGL